MAVEIHASVRFVFVAACFNVCWSRISALIKLQTLTSWSASFLPCSFAQYHLQANAPQNYKLKWNREQKSLLQAESVDRVTQLCAVPILWLKTDACSPGSNTVYLWYYQQVCIVDSLVPYQQQLLEYLPWACKSVFNNSNNSFIFSFLKKPHNQLI